MPILFYFFSVSLEALCADKPLIIVVRSLFELVALHWRHLDQVIDLIFTMYLLLWKE